MNSVNKNWQSGDCTFNGVDGVLDVTRLWYLSKDLKVKSAPVDVIRTDEWTYWCANLKDFLGHMKQVLEANLDYPIILSDEGIIMDGRHRLAKAIWLKHKTIKYVRFDVTPTH